MINSMVRDYDILLLCAKVLSMHFYTYRVIHYTNYNDYYEIPKYLIYSDYTHLLSNTHASLIIRIFHLLLKPSHSKLDIILIGFQVGVILDYFDV